MISIPEYFKKFINPNLDLYVTPKICCPFHEEDTPSFSFSVEKGIWRCFGACHTGGDVIALHQKNFHLPSRTVAQKDLLNRLGVKNTALLLTEHASPDYAQALLASLMARALFAAKTVEDWIDLDYIMSVYPPDTKELQAFCERVEMNKKDVSLHI